MNFLKELWKDENGAVATEYVILVGLIAIALIGSLYLFREKLYDLISGYTNDLDDGTGATGTGVGQSAGGGTSGGN
jgi:Flp pilus assembly pilin Flp